jgi:hypothetical protein
LAIFLLISASNSGKKGLLDVESFKGSVLPQVMHCEGLPRPTDRTAHMANKPSTFYVPGLYVVLDVVSLSGGEGAVQTLPMSGF